MSLSWRCDVFGERENIHLDTSASDGPYVRQEIYKKLIAASCCISNGGDEAFRRPDIPNGSGFEANHCLSNKKAHIKRKKRQV